MMTMKQALITMLKARLRETRENEPIYDHEYWRNDGREDTLEEIIELVEAMKD